MENYPFQSIEEVNDISSLDQYQVALQAGLSREEALAVISRSSRDNARTPMQWNQEANAGFTTGTPWLKVNPNYRDINAECQLSDPDSVFSFYRKLIALRKNPVYQNTIVYGSMEPVWEDHQNLMAYFRKGDKTLLVAGNFQKKSQRISLEQGYKKVLLNNLKDLKITGNELELLGYQAIILEI